MSKKDYVLIAGVVANTPRVEETSRSLIAAALADAFASDNPNFDRKRFIAACDVKEIQ